MATFSQNLLITELTPADPATLNTWGATWNTNLALIDSSITGELDLNVGGSADVILTSVQGQPDQSRNVTFIFTGVLTGNINVLWPQSLKRNFRVLNRTTGNFTLTVGANNGSGAPAGATFAVPQDGSPYALSSNGTGIGLWLGGYLPLTGGSVSGNFSVIRDGENIAAQMTISGDAGNNRALNFDTASNLRFNLFVTNEAESGAAAGSNLILAAYLNNGVLVGNVFKVFRNTQVLQFLASPTMPTPTAGDSSTNGANTLYVDRQAFATAGAAESFTTSYAYPLSGGGNLTVGGLLNISGAAGTNRSLVWETGVTPRWSWLTNATAESGGNAGSNFFLQSFNDAGSLISNVMSVTRSTGIVGFSQIPTVPTAPLGDDSTSAANTAFVTNTFALSAVSATHTGTGIFVRIARITLTVPTGGATYIVTAQVGQTFGAGTSNWGLEFAINSGTVVNNISSVIPQNSATLMAQITLAAGAGQTIDLFWFGQNVNVSLLFGTLAMQLSQ